MRSSRGKALGKILVSVLVITLVPLLISVDANAEESSKNDDVYAEIDQIIDDFSRILPESYDDLTNIREVTESLGVKRILNSIAGEIAGRRSEAVTLLLTLVGVSLLGCLASLYVSEMSSPSSRAVGGMLAALLFERLYFLVVGSIESLREIGDFFAAVIPVCLAVNSLGITPATATAQAVGMGITLGIYSYASTYVILPLVMAAFVSAAASSFDSSFGRIAKGIRSILLWGMGIFTTLVGAVFSLQSVVAASSDSAALRGAKYAISSTIPIVGGTVSSAIGILSSGVSYSRGIVGGGAIAVILSLAMSPLVTLLLYRICLRVGALLSSVISSDGCASVLSAFVGAIDLVIAAYALTATVYVIELVAFLKGGVTAA